MMWNRVRRQAAGFRHDTVLCNFHGDGSSLICRENITAYDQFGNLKHFSQKGNVQVRGHVDLFLPGHRVLGK
ncbi:MAG: hypothetical protein ACLU4N_12855 [Butyricimonas faecihominis]